MNLKSICCIKVKIIVATQKFIFFDVLLDHWELYFLSLNIRICLYRYIYFSKKNSTSPVRIMANKPVIPTTQVNHICCLESYLSSCLTIMVRMWSSIFFLFATHKKAVDICLFRKNKCLLMQCSSLQANSAGCQVG